MSQFLVATGRCRVETEADHDQPVIRIGGRAYSANAPAHKQTYDIALTQEQARDLISELKMALHELELQRTAALARVTEGEGVASDWDYSCPDD